MRRSVGIALALAAAALLGGAAPAWAAGCVEVEASVSPAQICPGGNLMVTTRITNCGDLMDRITVSVSGMGEEMTLPSFRLGAGKTRSVAARITVPLTTSPGTYTVEVTATSSYGASDSDDATVEVVSCQ